MVTRTERKLKGLRSFSARDNSTLPGKLLVLPTPTAPEIDPGITQLLNLTKSDLGEDVVESIEVTSQQPLITATFPAVSPQLLSLRYMRQLATATGQPFNVTRTFRAVQNAYAGAIATKFGNGMVADQADSTMSVISALGEATALTRLPFAGFDNVGTTDSFGQGADGALALSDNVVGSDVSLDFPHTQDGLIVSENPITDLDISMLVVMSDLKIFRVDIPSVTVDLEASGNIPVGVGEMALTFRATYDGSTCVPITYSFVDQAIAC